jgi:hypothetical protein
MSNSVLWLPVRGHNLGECSFEEWSSILDLSTRWGFTSIHDLAIGLVEPPDPLERLTIVRSIQSKGGLNQSFWSDLRVMAAESGLSGWIKNM